VPLLSEVEALVDALVDVLALEEVLSVLRLSRTL